MYPGLKETSLMLHRLLEREVRELGAQNVVLGGLSQGCAAALVAGRDVGGGSGVLWVVAAGGEVDGGVRGAICEW